MEIIRRLNRVAGEAIAIAAVLMFICSCQKRPTITVYMGPSSGQAIEGLNVENGDYQAALERCQERLQQLKEGSVETADVYSIMGLIYAEHVGDREKAVYYLDQAREIHLKEEDEIGLAVIMSHKGELFRQVFRYEEALDAFQDARNIYMKRKEENINIHLFTGQTYLEMGEYGSAEREFFEAKRICAVKGNLYKEADANWMLGDLYLEREDFGQAINHYEKALDFYKTNEIYLYEEALMYSYLAYTYNHSGNLEEAITWAIDASRMIERSGLDAREEKDSQKVYKHNLSMYYKGWTEDMTEEGFEAWYQKVVIDDN